jgi:hypothetical protein
MKLSFSVLADLRVLWCAGLVAVGWSYTYGPNTGFPDLSPTHRLFRFIRFSLPLQRHGKKVRWKVISASQTLWQGNSSRAV